MKKSVIAVILLATSVFGIEPSELVRLYRGSLTNDVISRELQELLAKNRNLFSELKPRMNGTELLLLYGVIDSVSTTSENLIITFRSGGLMVEHNGVIRGTAEYAANNEALILTPDQETSIYEHHASVRFIPVSFKSKKKGFRIIDRFAYDGVKSYVAYVALSDKPTEASEDDVEMIMEGGEWKTAKEYYAIVERENRLHELRFEYIYKRREAEKLLQGEELTNRLAVIEHEARLEKERIESGEQDEPSEEKSKASHFWLYVILFHLILFPCLYFMRKKFSRKVNS